MNQEKKLYIITSILALVGLLYLGVNEYFRYQNVSNALMINKFSFENLKVYKAESLMNDDTKQMCKKYKISFNDRNSNKFCQGFLVLEKSGKVTTDLLCQ
jgi:hypothetical protein